MTYGFVKQSLIRTNPAEAFGVFARNVSNSATSGQRVINNDSLYSGFRQLRKQLEIQQPGTFNNLAAAFIESLVALKQDELAGVLYSHLIKMNKDNLPLVKIYAQKALAIAKRNNDPVHRMARADDICYVCAKTKPGSPEHIKYLYEQRTALKDICAAYDTTLPDRFHTVSRELSDLSGYELKLSALDMDLAIYIAYHDPKRAESLFDEAKNLFIKNKDCPDRNNLASVAKKIGNTYHKLAVYSKK